MPMGPRISDNALIQGMKDALGERVYFTNELVDKLGSYYERLKRLADKNGIRLGIKDQRLRLLHQVIREKGSIDDVVKLFRTSEHHVSTFAKAHDIMLPYAWRSRHTDEERLAVLEEVVEQGELSLKRIVEEVRTTPLGLWEFLNRNGIELTEHVQPYKYRPELDELIELGISRADMAAIRGIGRETVRQYLLASGQFKQWYQLNRQLQKQWTAERKQRKSMLPALPDSPKPKGRLDWAYEHAASYFTSYPAQEQSFEHILRMFRNYKRIMQRADGGMLGELLKGTGIGNYQTARNILLKMGMPFPGKTWNRVEIPEQEKKRLLRSWEHGLSLADISYFSGRTYDQVRELLEEPWQDDDRKRERPHLRFGRYKDFVTTRLASHIYQLADNGVPLQTIQDKTRANQGQVQTALDNRAALEPKLIHALRALTGNRQLSTPYLP